MGTVNILIVCSVSLVFFSFKWPNSQTETILHIKTTADQEKPYEHLHTKPKFKFPDEKEEDDTNVFSPATEKLLLSLLKQTSQENSIRNEQKDNGKKSGDGTMIIGKTFL